jgi:hypothetical protein
MLQIAVVVLFLLVGVTLLAKGELKATERKVVKGPVARGLGAGACALAALPIVLDPLTGIVAALGLFLVASAIVVAITPPSQADAHRGEPEEEQRVESLGRQIVGEPCVGCAKDILVASEGAACPGCGEPVHDECLRAHKKAAHPKKRSAA